MARFRAFLIYGFFLAPWFMLFLIEKKPLNDLAILKSDTIWALKNSLIQASMGSLFGLFLGVLGSWGLLSIKNEGTQKFCELLVLLPSLLPPLFMMFPLMAILNPFPFGNIGVSITYALIQSGLVSVALAQSAKSKVGPLTKVCALLGVKRLAFLFKIYFPIIKRELVVLFVLLMLSLFTSFSVPLLFGGSSGTNLEVLIYEYAILNGNIYSALPIACLQTLISLSLIYFLRGQSWNLKPQTSNFNFSLFYRFFSFLPFFLFLFVPLFFLEKGFTQLKGIGFNWHALSLLSLNTLLLGILAGGLTYFLTLIVAFSFQDTRLQYFLKYYSVPSPVLLGLCFFIFLNLIKMNFELAAALLLIISFYTSLYRFFMLNPLKDLKQQIQVARQLGASNSLLAWYVLIPQLLSPISIITGLSAIWAMGDFALGKVLSTDNKNLAIEVSRLMSHYRSDAASVLLLYLMLLCLLVYLFFWRMLRAIHYSKI